MSTQEPRLKIACRVFEILSYVFLATGLITVVLSLTAGGDMLPHANMFVIIGSVALLTTKVGLSQSCKWSWFILAMLFVPWALIGLTLDYAHEQWFLVASEIIGLVMVGIALVMSFPPSLFKKLTEATILIRISTSGVIT